MYTLLALALSQPPAAPDEWARLKGAIKADGTVAAAGAKWQTGHGFRWQILLRDPDGEYRPAPLAAKYKTGDAFRVRVEPLTDLHLYVLARQSDGRLDRATPVGKPFELTAGKPIDLPSGGGGYQFRGDDGKCVLQLVAVPKPLAAAEDAGLVKAMEARQKGVAPPDDAGRAFAKRLVALDAKEQPAGAQPPPKTPGEALRRPPQGDKESALVFATDQWFLATYLSPQRSAAPVLVHDIPLAHSK